MNPPERLNAHVLVVEDEATIRHFLRTALLSEGCQVHEADTLARGRIDAASRKPDLIVLDLGLPDGDGLQLIEAVRPWSSLPILVLSARLDERDKVVCLDAGADDYLTKPFGVAEFLARIRALLRRSLRATGEADGLVRIGDNEIDLARRTIGRDGQRLHLTPIEFKLLQQLLHHAGRVITHRQLLAQIWGPNHVEDTHYLRVYMAGLRRKIERDPAQPRHILTETGVGYRLER